MGQYNERDAGNISKGDYIGFTYNGIHTSQFGLYRTSDGDRYNMYLSPTVSHLTQTVNGMNGAYYFGANYGTYSFPTMQLAFDSISESEIVGIRKWLLEGIKELIFDETPYIKYYVTVNDAPTLKYVPFLDTETNTRIYKGELEVTFVSFDGMGHSVHKWLNQYTDSNKEEWAIASGLQNNSNNTYDSYNTTTHNVEVYNAGNLPCDFVLTLTNITLTGESSNVTIQIGETTSLIEFVLPPSSSSQSFDKIIYDSAKCALIYYITPSGGTQSIKIRNDCIINGDFFQIPIGKQTIDLSSFQGTPNVSIDYSYLYR